MEIIQYPSIGMAAWMKTRVNPPSLAMLVVLTVVNHPQGYSYQIWILSMKDIQKMVCIYHTVITDNSVHCLILHTTMNNIDEGADSKKGGGRKGGGRWEKEGRKGVREVGEEKFVKWEKTDPPPPK